jgi:hypothetical protein
MGYNLNSNTQGRFTRQFKTAGRVRTNELGIVFKGLVTLDKHITLQCSNVTDPTYVLTIQGNIYSDSHMEGTEIATNTNDPSYHHVYYWKAY